MASTDVLCWRCREPLLQAASFRWGMESFGVAVVLTAVLWGLGAVTRSPTLLLLWGLVYLLLWVPRASLLGATRAQTYAPWIASVYRWMMGPLALFLVATYPGNVGEWVAAAADGVVAPEALGMGIWTTLTFGLVAVCADIMRVLGVQALMPWAPSPLERF